MDTPRALIIRDGNRRLNGNGHQHALVVASPSPHRSELVQALRAKGFDVVVEGQHGPSCDWAGDSSLDLVILDLSAAGLRALGALGSEDAGQHQTPRIVLVTGEHGSDESVERALHAAAFGNASEIRRGGDPARYAALVDEAKGLALAREFPAALSRLEEAVDVDDRRPEAFNLFGVIAEIRGERAEAQVHWRIALLLDPENRPAQDNLRRRAQIPRMRGALALG